MGILPLRPPQPPQPSGQQRVKLCEAPRERSKGRAGSGQRRGALERPPKASVGRGVVEEQRGERGLRGGASGWAGAGSMLGVLREKGQEASDIRGGGGGKDLAPGTEMAVAQRLALGTGQAVGREGPLHPGPPTRPHGWSCCGRPHTCPPCCCRRHGARGLLHTAAETFAWRTSPELPWEARRGERRPGEGQGSLSPGSTGGGPGRARTSPPFPLPTAAFPDPEGPNPRPGLAHLLLISSSCLLFGFH